MRPSSSFAQKIRYLSLKLSPTLGITGFALRIRRLISQGFISGILGMGIFAWSPTLAVPLQFQEGMILEDSEIKEVLTAFLHPALKALGNIGDISLYLVSSPTLNAFATGDRSIYFNTGLIIAADSAEELISVLFHELGHIAGHHSIHRLEAIRRSHYQSLVPLVLGLIAAGLTNQLGLLSMGGLIGMYHSHTSLLGFTRAQESAADQFALKLFQRLRWPVHGFAAFMKKLAEKERTLVSEQSLYLRTHPFSQQRALAAQSYLHQEEASLSLPASFSLLFEKLKIKVLAFSTPLPQVLSSIDKVKLHNPSLRDYGKAIAYYRLGQGDKALEYLNKFSASHPSPFVEELRAQIFFETRQLPEALQAIERATKSRPLDPLVNTLKAQILIESQQPGSLSKAIQTLEKNLFAAFGNPQIWYWLGVAYGRQQNMGRMRICFAEYAFIQQDYPKARFHLDAAKRLLPPHDLYAQRAQQLEEILKKIPPSSQPPSRRAS